MLSRLRNLLFSNDENEEFSFQIEERILYIYPGHKNCISFDIKSVLAYLWLKFNSVHFISQAEVDGLKSPNGQLPFLLGLKNECFIGSEIWQSSKCKLDKANLLFKLIEKKLVPVVVFIC